LHSDIKKETFSEKGEKMVKKFFVFVAVMLLIFISAFGIWGSDLSPENILNQADDVRNPQSDYTVEVTVTSLKPGKEPKVAQYEVMIKGKTKTIIKTLAPAVDRGTSMLMVNYDFWVFLPTISKPLRISLQQRLLGEVANGDIARANFSGDYSPKLLKMESIDGLEYYVLELLAKDERVTYHRVVLWVQKENFHPFKAEFYAVSGRILKTASYEDYRQIAGKLRPARLVLNDPLVRGQRSIIEYSQIIPATLPDKYFTEQHLKKLKY
jgi:outer membrane lipoprotein-sorting protein